MPMYVRTLDAAYKVTADGNTLVVEKIKDFFGSRRFLNHARHHDIEVGEVFRGHALSIMVGGPMIVGSDRSGAADILKTSIVVEIALS